MSEEIRKKIEEKYPLIGEASDVKWCLNYRGRIAAEFGYQLAIEERKKELRMSPIVDVRSKEPSQDELWEELESTCMGHDGASEFLMISEAKKRYRITRVTS